MKRLALSLLAVLAVARFGWADSYIVSFHAFAPERKDKETRNADWALIFRLPAPLCCRPIPYKKATPNEFLKKLREVKRKAKKGDVVVVYIGAHGGEVEGGGGLSVCCREGWVYDAELAMRLPSSSVGSKDFFPILEALPCPTLLLIDTCHSGAALQHKWKKTTVICSARHDEISWTGGMNLALLEALRQHRNWTIEELARYIVARTTAFSKDQHAVAFIGSTAKVRLTDPRKVSADLPADIVGDVRDPDLDP